MHIPDGFLAPQVYIPAYFLDLSLIFYALKSFKEKLKERTVPFIASLSVMSFIFMSIAVPMPGGTSVHGLGVASISLLFGPWVAFVCISLVLFLQASVFGEGGVTSFSINSLGIGFIGSLSAYYVYRVLSRFIDDRTAIFISGFLSTILSALFIALVLGLHPYLFTDPSGKPIYFPFKFNVVIPAVLLPHIPVGVGEGLLTLLVVKTIRSRI
ncbi:MAG: energy-coupling factor ABC transporter permease [Aquificaceae bacterium]